MFINGVLNKLSKKFLIYSFGQAFNLVTPILISPYLIRKCNLDGFGKTGTAFALMLFLILIVDYGFDIKGIKKISETRNSPNHLQEELNATLFTKIILFFCALTIGLVIVFFIPYFHREKTLFILSFSILFAQIFNPTWFLQGIEDFKASSLLNIFSKTLYVIFIFTFINNQNDYILVNFLLGLSSLILNCIGLIYIYKKNKFEIRLPLKNCVLNILKDDFTLCISQLFLSVRQLSPLFITSYLFGFKTAGEYKVIDQIISLFRTLSQVFFRYFYPQLCYKLNRAKNNAIYFWRKYSVLLLTGVTILVFILTVFSINVLRFFNINEIIIIKMQFIFKFSLIIPIVNVISLALEQLMFGVHNNKLYFKITFIVTLFNLLTLILFSLYIQIPGILISIFLSEILFVYFYYQYAYKKLVANEV